jgi:2-dehydro-3-deoxyphosphogluconate aldolase / (4S)-4-hydroxy-2-oxoglutarate aldolase
MNIDSVIARIGEIGVIPVIRASSVEQALRAVEAISAGGIPIVEITMTVPDAPAVIRNVVQHHGSRVLVGAGTVISAEQAKRSLEAGAEFLVSPGLSMPALMAGQNSRKLVIPGALTPTELMNAHAAGATLVKIFPCGSVGGPKYLKSLKGPFPDAALIPTGGVSVQNAAEFIAAGAFAVGVGSELVDSAALREGNLSKITAAASQLAQAVRAARDQIGRDRSGAAS